MRRLLRFSLLVALSLFGGSALANRFEFAGMNGGSRVAGAEVCLYRGIDPHNPFQRFFQTSDIHCLGADSVLDIPNGIWNFFIRSGDKLVTGDPAAIRSAGPRESGYKELQWPLYAAVTVDFSTLLPRLGEQEFYALLQAAPTGATWVQPVPSDAPRVLVPAGATIVPMIVKRGQPVRIGTPMVAAAGKAAVPAFDNTPGTGDVLLWLSLDLSFIESPERRDLKDFTVELKSEDRTIASALPMKIPAAMHESFVLFKNVPRGAAALRLSSPYWETDEQTVLVDRPLVLVKTPLRTAPASLIVARWSAEPLAAACDGKQAPAVEGAARLYTCPQLTPDSKAADMEIGKCTQAMEHPFTLRDANGEIEFGGVTTGTYLLSVKAGSCPEVRSTVRAEPSKKIVVDVPLQRKAIHGRVTKNGAPVAARVIFRTGSGYSDAMGNYVAPVSDDPRQAPIRVQSCDGAISYLEAPADRVFAGDTYDIDIPEQFVDVLVRDENRQPVAGAKVIYASLVDADHDRAHFATNTFADANGRAHVGPLRPGILLSLCASSPDRDLACAPRKTLARTSDAPLVTIDLAAGARRGRIEVSSAIDRGTLYWLTMFGQVSEVVAVAPDGSFTQVQSHPKSERPLLVAANLPMNLLDVTRGETGDVILRPATTIVQDLVIDLGESFAGGGAIALTMNGVRIPELAVARHQSLRGMPSSIVPGKTLTIPQVAMLKPIYVIVPTDADESVKQRFDAAGHASF